MPREEARVSVFDGGFVLGDGVWEGLRVHRGCIAFLDTHLDRLDEGAKALDPDVGLERPALTEALYETLRVNAMSEDVHIRPSHASASRTTPPGCGSIACGHRRPLDGEPAQKISENSACMSSHERLSTAASYLSGRPYFSPFAVASGLVKPWSAPS